MVSLKDIAMEDEQYMIAQRCASALKDMASLKALSHVNDIIIKYNHDLNDPNVKAAIAILKQYKVAELIYLQQGEVNTAINMHIVIINGKKH